MVLPYDALNPGGLVLRRSDQNSLFSPYRGAENQRWAMLLIPSNRTATVSWHFFILDLKINSSISSRLSRTHITTQALCLHSSLVHLKCPSEQRDRQRENNHLQVAALNDFIPVSMSGREEDLKIALRRLAGKANKSHSSLLGALSLSWGKRTELHARCNVLFYAVSN